MQLTLGDGGGGDAAGRLESLRNASTESVVKIVGTVKERVSIAMLPATWTCTTARRPPHTASTFGRVKESSCITLVKREKQMHNMIALNRIAFVGMLTAALPK